ncbi:S-glutathionyl-(chloro)hydroquinone reductase [Pleurotus ostreatus]|nr:S-glutathionyl-(chloro)hydroquinone reductase [Pleurotus ostreatus]
MIPPRMIYIANIWGCAMSWCGWLMGDSWLKKLYWNNEAFKVSTNFNHIKTHYYWSHTTINPTRIVPVGPFPDIEPL